MFVFRKIWRALFSSNIRFEIRSFALSPSICRYIAQKEKNMIRDPNEIGSTNESELSRNVTRRKLNFPKEELCGFVSVFM